jgi:hypothetical protein
MKKYKFLLFIVALSALLYSQIKVVLPFMVKVAASDLFLVQSNDQASQIAISTPLTNIAFKHCNNYIKSELGSDVNVIFPEKPLNVWSLGNYQYLISADITATDDKAVINNIKYACRITYNDGDDQEGILDFDNWSINGLTGLENLK